LRVAMCLLDLNFVLLLAFRDLLLILNYKYKKKKGLEDDHLSCRVS
jgi:hypothetical protein